MTFGISLTRWLDGGRHRAELTREPDARRVEPTQGAREIYMRVIELKLRAAAAGMRPLAVELGDIECVRVSPYYRDQVCGLKLIRRAEPGVAVLAMPDRRIGRYECVVPTRFEEPA